MVDCKHYWLGVIRCPECGEMHKGKDVMAEQERLRAVAEAAQEFVDGAGAGCFIPQNLRAALAALEARGC